MAENHAVEVAPASLRIWLLGGLRAERDGRVVPEQAWRRNRARALVKLLSLCPGQRLHREQLVDTLWPDLDAESGRANLRKAVHFARQAIGHDSLHARGELIGLEGSPLWVDIAAFEAAADADQPEVAVALYTGDLLPEDRYEPWTDDVRERLRGRYLRLLLALGADHERTGDIAMATVMLERLVAGDPLNEEASRRLMRLHALAGARHLALRRYRELENALREELDVGPSGDIESLYQEILDGRFPRAVAGQRPSPRPASAAEGEHAAGEERKLVTVLWTEAAVAAADPEDTRLRLGSWAAKTAAIIDSWGAGTDIQADGSIVALFGVPTAHEDDAARALRAALEIRGSADPVARTGIASGEVIVTTGPDAGPVPIAGSVLVTAGRLRELAQPGAILVAGRTRRNAPREFRFSTPLSSPEGEAYPLGDAQGERAGIEPETPMVGRESELAALLALFDDARERRQPQLALISGSAGVGKSRLARDFVASAVSRCPDTLVLRGRCLPAGRATYGALGDVLREACGIWLNESAESARALFSQRLRHLLGDLDSNDTEATIFALATTAGIALNDNPLDRLEPEEVAEHLSLAWTRFTSACAAAVPTLMVLEDLHWAGAELLEMVKRIAGRSSGALMLLLTARPELRLDDVARSGGPGDLARISLRPLSHGHSRQLLDHLATGRHPRSDIGEQILARAEGNPLYLEQLALHLRAQASASLPDTLQSLLTARLDSLAPAERRLLQEAAVVGRAFWAEPLRRALPGERITARLGTLERAGFIVRRPGSSLPGQTEFSFRHALLHDAAYESLPRARRARAHAAVGGWLEELAHDRLDEVVDMLAHHFGSAHHGRAHAIAWTDASEREGVRLRAYVYVLRAGEAARRRFATGRAIELDEQAVELAANRDEKVVALEALAEDHESVYHGEKSAARYREAIELASQDHADADSQNRMSRKLAWQMVWNPGAFSSSPDPAEVERLVAGALASTADEAERAWLLLVSGVAARLYKGSEPFGQGRRDDPRTIADRIDMAEEAVAVARTLHRTDVITAGERALGTLYGLAGRFADVLALDRRNVEALGPQSTGLERCEVSRKLAVDLIHISAEFEPALALALGSRGLAREFSPHALMHTTYAVMAALFHLGRWKELLPFLDEHVAAFRTEPALECQFVRDGPVIGAAALMLLGRRGDAAQTAALVGDPLVDRESASAWQSRWAVFNGDPATARAISWDKARQRRTYGPQHALSLIEALVALTEWEELLSFLPDARGAIDGNALLGPVADRAEGLAMHARGETEAAKALLHRSVRSFRALHTPWEEAQALMALATVTPRAEAAAARRSALALGEQLGSDRLRSVG